MAPIDFEKELQKRWRSREIKPREQVWTRLSARLEQQAPASNRGPKLWIAMAAASIIVLVGFFLLRQPAATELSLPPVVQSPEADFPTGVTASPERDALSDPQKAEAESLTARPPAQRHDVPSAGQENGVAGFGNPQPPEPDVTRLLAETREKVTPEGALTAAVIVPPAERAETDPGQGGTLEAEIDDLLENARERIGHQSEPAGVTPVDTRALLDRAEDELDQTFREKIMEKLKSGVTRFRTGVVDRDK